MKVNVNTELIRSKTNEVDKLISTYNTKISSVKKTVDEIDASNSWKGKDFDSFKDKMSSFSKELETIEKNIQLCNSFIQGYIKTVEGLENYYKTKNIKIN